MQFPLNYVLGIATTTALTTMIIFLATIKDVE